MYLLLLNMREEKDDTDLVLRVGALVDKGKDNQFIESKLFEKGVDLKKINELMQFADDYREQIEAKEQEDRGLNKGLLIFWLAVIAIVVAIVLITGNDEFYLEGAIVAISLHQIVSLLIKLYW